MMNGKQEKPLRGGKGLIKLSYFIFSTDCWIIQPLMDGSMSDRGLNG